jgi:hypothetical protein
MGINTSEETAASIFRIDVSCTLKMEAAGSFESW